MSVLRSTLILFGVTSVSTLRAQTLMVTNDNGKPLLGVQTVNVGEHVRLRMQASPTGTRITDPVWVISGIHLRDWSTKDGDALGMGLTDYTRPVVHFMWKDVTALFFPNVVQARAIVAGVPRTVVVRFRVVRNPKAEKYYSDDMLMENHNNWHNVYLFAAASTRRGDAFLAWHRSQLDFYNRWRAYFGYSPASYWDPTNAWIPPGASVTELLVKTHPSNNPIPQGGFSTRHNIVTLDLTNAGLATAREGQYDLTTATLGRGTNSQFVAAGYILRTETVCQVLACPPVAAVARTGVASVPTWWQPNTGQIAADPWFQAGCPALQTPSSTANSLTCTATSKRSFDDYTLRQLGESIESGIYALDFQVNYHALGHIAASQDMAEFWTSMRDPIFWGWHASIDSILTRWQRTRGVEAAPPLTTYGAPQFDATWSHVRVAFSNRVVPEFVLPANVTVNGSTATAVADVSLTGTGYIFEFSGFAVPPSGPVEVVVRREINDQVRTNGADPRPRPTLIFSTYGNILTPPVVRFAYTRP